MAYCANGVRLNVPNLSAVYRRQALSSSRLASSILDSFLGFVSRLRRVLRLHRRLKMSSQSKARATNEIMLSLGLTPSNSPH